MDGFVFNFLACFASVSCLMVVTATTQDVPDICGGQADCVDFLSDGQWRGLTERCCADQPDTVYHCQQQDGKVIVTCLLPVTCPIGHVPLITKDQNGRSGHVTLSCKVCEEGYFQPNTLESYHYRYPRCQRTKQTCPAVSGKVMVSQGDSSQDSRCRCGWEEGWVPRYAGSRSQCIDPAGFVKDDMCECVRHDCDEGKRPNQDYQCVDASSLPFPTKQSAQTTSPPLSTTALRTHEAKRKQPQFIPSDRKFPGGLAEDELKYSRDTWATVLSVIAAVTAAVPVVIIFYGCNRLIRA